MRVENTVVKRNPILEIGDMVEVVFKHTQVCDFFLVAQCPTNKNIYLQGMDGSTHYYVQRGFKHAKDLFTHMRQSSSITSFTLIKKDSHTIKIVEDIRI